MIDNFILNTGYEALISGAAAACIAQIIKFLLFTASTGKINFKIFTTTGGMPSAHSAAVVALSTTIGIIRGFDSVTFAIAAGFSMIIMYDAAGLRRAAGKTAASLNRIMEDFYKHDLEAVGPKLKELLGHTPLEVIVGAVFGIFWAYYFHHLLLI